MYDYFIESGVCYNCYKKMQALPTSISCFGKLGKQGFNPISRECKSICPDRKACPLFATNKIKKLRQHHVHRMAEELDNVELIKQDDIVQPLTPPFRPGSVIFDAFKLCCGGVSMREFSNFAKRRKCDKTRLLRIFRGETIYKQKWQWTEADGVYQIHYPVKS